MGGSVGVAILIILITTIAIGIGSYWLEDASAMLAVYYDLPPVVQGGIIAAVGSSFPELASVVVAALAGSFDLGVGVVVGSAIFNILVIPGLAVVLSPGSIDANRTLVHKDTMFYLLAVVVLFLTFALALIYTPGNGLTGELTRPLVLVPLAVYGLYLFLQWQDTADYAGRSEPMTINRTREWLKLAAGLVVILVAVHYLVHAVLTIGATAGTSEFLWGVIVVAAATSLPDAVVSIKAANRQHDVASMSNVVGSNTFDLLVVIPIGVLITGSATFDFGIAAPMMGCLIGATVVLFVALRTDLELSQREAYVLLLTYGAFILWVLAEALEVVTILP